MKEVLLKAEYDKGFLYNISKKFNVSMRVLKFMPSSKENVDATVLVEFYTHNKNFKKIISFFENARNECPYFSTYELIYESKNSFIVLINLCSSHGSKAIYESGCLLNDCQIDDGGIYFNLLTIGENSLCNFIDYLKKSGFNIRIIKKRKYSEVPNLTIRERNIMKLAFDKGYFDIPKKIRLKELSMELDVSISSLDEILKKAERKILANYFIKR